ncbi:MAG: APC family permease [Myxococcota bacterium]
MSEPGRSLGGVTLAQLAVASMVGTGVFTSSGYLLDAVPSAPAVLLAWIVGGFVSLCGALAYAELCAALPENGGEYALLTRIYHPRVGFAAGVVSIFAGFGGALSAVALGAGEYGAAALGLDHPLAAPSIALLALALGGLLHSRGVSTSARGQNAITALKVIAVLAFAIGLLLQADPSHLSVAEVPLGEALLRPAMATGLVYVAYAYSGWNAAAYVAGEAGEPAKLHRAFSGATAGVTALYVLLNAAFLAAAPMGALRGQTDIAHVATQAAYGTEAARAVSAVIALGLLSTLGAMLMTGARVLEAMVPVLRRRRPDASPIRSVAALCALTVPLIVYSNVSSLLLYAGSALTLSAMLTAAGVFVLRRREPELHRPYRTFLHPLSTGIFVLFSAWMLAFAVYDAPKPSLCALATAALPALFYTGRRAPTSK